MKKILKEKLKQSKGITLIALVITIIVLLILAGVSIAMLTGSNGILGKASEAKLKTDKADAKEQVQLAVMGSFDDNGKLDPKLLGDNLDIAKATGYDESKELPQDVTIKGQTVTIKADGTVENKGQAEGEKTETIAEAKAETELATENKQITAGGTFILPEGFRVTADSADTIKEGVVITDGTSEFVWIPVDNINDMAQCETAGGDCDLKLENGKLKCTNPAHASTSESIVGKLYAINWGENFGTENTTYNVNSGLREPALVTYYDQDASNKYYEKAGYNSSNEMLQGMKNEYIAMVTSVEKYKGFYVGRYETSLDGNKVAKSKGGVESATADGNSADTWYGMYKAENAYNKNSVKGQMIWGSQYDAMMNWMKQNDINVKEIPDDNTPPKNLQNAKRNKTRITGGNDNQDKLNNVYDILGNSLEWTAEAGDTYYRVYRGGYYNRSFSPSIRYNSSPGGTGSNVSSRLTLYIK